ALYSVLPAPPRPRVVTPGAIVAVFLWIAASLGFSFYVSSFGRYEVIYGALGGVIVLLLWMWFSSLAVLLGAELNAVLARRAAEPRAIEIPPPDVAAPNVAEPPREPPRGASPTFVISVWVAAIGAALWAGRRLAR